MRFDCFRRNGTTVWWMLVLARGPGWSWSVSVVGVFVLPVVEDSSTPRGREGRWQSVRLVFLFCLFVGVRVIVMFWEFSWVRFLRFVSVWFLPSARNRHLSRSSLWLENLLERWPPKVYSYLGLYVFGRWQVSWE